MFIVFVFHICLFSAHPGSDVSFIFRLDPPADILYICIFHLFSAAGQMGPFGAGLDFTVYEEDISCIFLLRPAGGISYIIICLYFTFPAHPEKVHFIHFMLDFPADIYIFILHSLSDRNKVLFFTLVPPWL